MSDPLTLRDNLIRVAFTAGPDVRPRLLQALTSAAMPEPEFWKIVDKIGWGTRTTDYKAIKRDLLRNMSPNQVASFRTTLAMLTGKLDKVITKWEEDHDLQIGTGDDGFSDLCNHIVGLGKRETAAVLRDPSLAHARARRGDYKESFSYCIPYVEDYKSLDPGHYRARGEEITEVVSPFLAVQEPNVRKAAGLIYTVVSQFADGRGEPESIIDQEFALIGAAKVLRDWLQKNQRDDVHIFALVQNLVSDMRDFLVD